jgi:hypothetical protein
MEHIYTKTDAIVSLKKFYEEFGTVSQYLYVQMRRKPSYPVFVKLFGSWNEAVVSSGLEVEKLALDKDRFIFDKESISAALKQHISRDSKLIFTSHYKQEHLLPSRDVVIQRFGSWRNAMLHIGIDMDRHGLRGQAKHRYRIADQVVNEAVVKWLSED